MTAPAAMALAAGYGTRLAPLTDELAKPACPVANRPLLHFALRRLATLGATTVVVNTHHLPATVRAALDPPPFGLDIRFIHEPVILGTGGGLKNARPWLAGADLIALLNGDTICEADLAEAAAAHCRSGALATMVLLDDPRAARYGAVETSADGAVVDIAGLRGAAPGARRGLFAGAHLLSPEIFAHLPPDEAFCIIRQAYLPLLAQRPGAVRATFGAGRFFDLGTPADYLAAQRALLDDPGQFAFFRDHLHEIAPRIWADPTAEISPRVEWRGPALLGRGTIVEDDARIGPYAVIGAGAQIAGGVRLENCVVWDDATVRESLRNAVATPRVVVAV